MSSFFINPRAINFNNRFDVLLKYMFVKSIDMNLGTSFYEDAYRDHLKVWNNFVEYDNPGKNDYEKFKNSFLELIESIKTGGYNEEIGSIPVFQNNILNGAHRTATCLYYSKEVSCRNSSDPKDGQLDCSWYFFKDLKRDGVGLDRWYTDQAALEYVDLFEDTKMVCLFPSAVRQGGLQQVRQALRETFGVFYEKEVRLNSRGQFNLMKELYYREAWAEANGGAGYREKANLCFGKDSDIPMVIFLVRMTREQAVDCKEKIRAFYKVGKHSVHINDTWEESRRIARAVFNENSLHFLNHASPTRQFEDFLHEFKKSSPENADDYCVTASMIMAAYGLREAKDIDYLYRTKPLVTNNPLISTHNQYLRVHYRESVDNLIMNPRNHFYCHGVKLISIDALRRMKQIRNEEKDRVDIEMMRTILRD